jgi:hypothetical protein
VTGAGGLAVEPVVLRSLGELIDRVTPDEPDPATGRRRDSGVYRGVGDARWPMLTSLDRQGGVEPPHTKCSLEEHILRNFARYSRPHVPTPPRNDWELARVGPAPRRPDAPARLDVLAARGRALRDHGAPAGAGVAGRRGAGQRPRDLAARLAARAPPLRPRRAGAHGRRPRAACATRRATAASRRGSSSPTATRVEPFACLFEPPTLDARIAAQSAVFTLASSTRQGVRRLPRRARAGGRAHLLRDPAARWRAVRDQLDLVSFDERRLFPDLDGVASQLRRYYS